MARLLVAIFCLVCLLCASVQGDRRAEEQHLRQRLSRNYNVKIRPKGDGNKDQTLLKVHLQLLKIHGLNTHTETLTSSFRLQLDWTDDRLTWKAADYGNATFVRMSSKDIWTPDVSLKSRRKETLLGNPMVKVSNTGKVSWQPSTEAETPCAVNMQLFPYDSQVCSLKFQTENYNGDEVQLVVDKKKLGPESIDTGDFETNPGWSVESLSASSVRKSDGGEKTDTAVFALELTRGASFVKFTFIAPATLVGLLVPFMFMLPPGSTAKTTMGFCLVLCVILLLGMILSYLSPNVPTPPMLGIYYLVLLVWTALALAVSAVLTVFSMRGPRKTTSPPSFLKKIFLEKLGRLVLVSYSKEEDGATDDAAGVRQYFLIALVIDRLLFILSMTCIILTTLIAGY